MLTEKNFDCPSGMAKYKICHFSSIQRELDYRTFYRQCMPLAKAGFNVVLLAPYKNSCKINGVGIISLPNRKNRIFRIFSTFFLLPKLLEQKADIYHFHDPELIPTALLLKLINKKKVIFDIREDFPSMMLLKYYIPKPLRILASIVVHVFELASSKFFDGIITGDPFVLNKFGSLDNNKKMVMYTYPSLDLFDLNDSHKIKKIYDIVYLGGMSERTGIYITLEAIEILISNGVKPKVLFAGYVDNVKTKERFFKYIKKRKLEEFIHIIGKIQHKNVPRLLAQAKIGIAPLQPVQKFLKNIPTKIFEYWACALPVVASNLPPAKLFMKDEEYGLLFNAKEPLDLAEKLERLLENPMLISGMGAKARNAVLNRYNSTIEANKLIKFYLRLLTR